MHPRWFFQRLNRLIYFRIAAISSTAAPRSVRLLVARAFGRAIGLHLTEEPSQTTIEPPIWVKPGDEMAALARMIEALERTVRASPPQRFNFCDV